MFPPTDDADAHGVVGLGADLEPGTLLTAYRNGLFPMPLGADGPIAWWSPDPRGVFELDGLHVSRSLRRSMRRFTITVDRDFAAVIDRCALIERPGAWITDEIRNAYVELHRLGWAHSVETRVGEELVGGLYGVNIGGLFAGESMFHTVADASKAALVALRELLDDGRPRLIDTQWLTPHLATLGGIEIDRARYLRRLHRLLTVAPPVAFDRPR